MRKLTLALTLAFLACSAGPTFPQTPVPFEPLEIYDQWWLEVQRCSGRIGRAAVIDWYLVPNGPWTDPTFPGLILYGLTNGRQVYIAGGQQNQAWIVKHEMLHVLGFHHDDAYPPYPWPFEGCTD